MKAGYYTEVERKCRFSMDYVTPGYRGLSWAILLKAIEDGCSRDWLYDIVMHYGIDFDVRLFDKNPANKIKINSVTNEMIAVQFTHKKTRKKSLLSLHDGLYVKGLEHVASD